ncbi:response regulator transcription factor [Motilibacter aurantiacus]|uniref:response regulator transcription factor n=1 Tax=Motilibacter aurantiacus TaxID=2714955 RepID=UPI00140AD079|nr:response regulator transcription factor [Motilibacter aurantiacus]NHC44557.1 response regulator transcription factor [Motilibacter aurantiacus]
MRVLVVEDDDRVAGALCSVLARHGFEVRRACNGEQALGAGTDTDVVLLDLGLPDVDGFVVGERLRHRSDVPIIMVTARSEVADRLRGLSIGADDYLSKPYDLRELIARIHAVTRRAQHAAVPTPRAATVTLGGGIVLDFDARTVSVDGRDVLLTRKEFEVLAVLARTPGIAVRREQLMGAVWNTSWKGTERTLEVHVASLRAKLGVPEAIVTVRGVGYRVLA